MTTSTTGESSPVVGNRRFVVGAGKYTEDLVGHGALHLSFVRSIYAHARLLDVRIEDAAALTGVVAVVTAESLGALNGPHPHPMWAEPPQRLRDRVVIESRPEVWQLLAVERVRYVGEPIAVVVATTKEFAEDAAAHVEVSYERLPVITDAVSALKSDAPLLNADWPDNISTHFTVGSGDVEEAFRRADRVVRRTITMPRSTVAPIENRAVAATPDGDLLTVWSSTQVPHRLRDSLVRILGTSQDRIRVIAPDVGGGFGLKGSVYPEEVVTALLAVRLHRQVAWSEQRREHLLSATHTRDQKHEIELAVTSEGNILGLRDRFTVDAGASNLHGLVCSYNTAAHLPGAYRIPALRLEGTAVLTNKSPSAPGRGAGRPEAVLPMERILDAVAEEIGIDPAEVRLRNLVRPDEMPYERGIPYRDGVPIVLDGADYPANLRHVMDQIGYEAFRADQAALIDAGRYVGIGLATYVQGTGIGPGEPVVLAIARSGSIKVLLGPPSQGQGHDTVFARLCADGIGVRADTVTVVQGDTFAMPIGGGTYASRTAVLVGGSIILAARSMRRKLQVIAAGILGVPADEVRILDGRIFAVRSPGLSIELSDLAAMLPSLHDDDQDDPIVLEEEACFVPDTVAFASGAHACIVEVDVETGTVEVVRYLVAHDCGRVLDATIVEGQLHGGVVHGLGIALSEELIYDENGQLVTGTFLEYGLPRASDVPNIEVIHLGTLTERSPQGIKGVGEAGTIPVAAVVLGAVSDALRPFKVELNRCPVSASRLVSVIRESKQGH